MAAVGVFGSMVLTLSRRDRGSYIGTSTEGLCLQELSAVAGERAVAVEARHRLEVRLRVVALISAGSQALSTLPTQRQVLP